MTDKARIEVREVMTEQLHIIDGLASIRQATEQMVNLGVSSLIVGRRDKHDEYGIITVTDIARDVIAKNRSADRVNVYEIMSKPMVTLHPEMDIRDGTALLATFELSRAVVVGATRELLGIVTLRDMVKHSLSRQSDG